MNCPYCREGFEEQGALAPWECPRCSTAVHAECAADHQGCVTFGCEGVELRPGRVTAELRVLTPRLGARVGARRALRAAVDVVAAPLEPLALAALALLGLASLALQG
ncbi:MAG: hypothetical protein R3F62_16535 [Planctomycetota bacterium]